MWTSLIMIKSMTQQHICIITTIVAQKFTMKYARRQTRITTMVLPTMGMRN
jgi:hypothetical protein